jgi:DNA end-binding protein Ku
MGTLLRYPYEVRKPEDYFDDIPDIKIDKEMLDLAKHNVQQKSGHFEPDQFEDRYETGLRELIQQKAAGKKIAPAKQVQAPNVINLMDALKRSVAAERAGKTAAAERASPARKQDAAKRSGTKSAKKRKAG